MNRKNTLAFAIAKVLAGTSLAALAPTFVMADEAEAPEVLEEVTVTAQLRSQSLQDVPIALQVVDKTLLQDVAAEEEHGGIARLQRFHAFGGPFGDRVVAHVVRHSRTRDQAIADALDRPRRFGVFRRGRRIGRLDLEAVQLEQQLERRSHRRVVVDDEDPGHRCSRGSGPGRPHRGVHQTLRVAIAGSVAAARRAGPTVASWPITHRAIMPAGT